MDKVLQFRHPLVLANNHASLLSTLCNILNMTKNVSSDFQTLRSGLKKRDTAEFFLGKKKNKINNFISVRILE